MIRGNGQPDGTAPSGFIATDHQDFMPVLFQFPDSLFRLCEHIHPHVNVGFFNGAAVSDPARLLQGTGKFMRHVKLRPGTATNAAALSRLIDAGYSDIKARVENG
jgi:hypothetical protein